MRAEGWEQEEKKKSYRGFTDLNYWGMAILVRYATGKPSKEIKDIEKQKGFFFLEKVY